MKYREILFIFLVILLSAGSFFIFRHEREPSDTVKITVNGELYCEKPLSEDGEININGTNTVIVENGAVYMKSADCPDKLCIKQGAVRDSAKKIICLPNRVIIEVTKKSEVDAVVK